MSVVSVVIPARNAAGTLGAALQGLALQDCADPFEVIVADDGSTDGTANVAREAGLSVRLLPGPFGGQAAARNAGVRESDGEILAFTDADCVPAPNWLRAGLEAIREADFVQGQVRPDPEATLGPFDRTIWVQSEFGLYECANLFVRRSLFDELGGFENWLPARLGKQLAEDAWFGWRARRSGARSRFSPAALVYHHVFERSSAGYVAERARLVYFPAIFRQMPELRETMGFAQFFLSARTAAFDVALVAAVAAGVAGRILPLAGCLFYVVSLGRAARRWGRRGISLVPADIAADVVGFGALLAGSIRARSVLI